MAIFPLRMIHLGLGAMYGILAQWPIKVLRMPRGIDIISSVNRLLLLQFLFRWLLMISRSLPGLMWDMFGGHLALCRRYLEKRVRTSGSSLAMRPHCRVRRAASGPPASDGVRALVQYSIPHVRMDAAPSISSAR
ncbi:MAG: hypothetical protein ABI877_15370 [Gemmatimonadaceae bacterium]